MTVATIRAAGLSPIPGALSIKGTTGTFLTSSSSQR
jgi:hypothetical protein